jgi:hypothetical protein
MLKTILLDGAIPGESPPARILAGASFHAMAFSSNRTTG